MDQKKPRVSVVIEQKSKSQKPGHNKSQPRKQITVKAKTASPKLKPKDVEALPFEPLRFEALPPQPAFADVLEVPEADRLRLYDALLLHQPQHIPAWINLGVALLGKGQRTAALVCHEKVLPACKTQASFWANYANILKICDQFEAAAQAYQMALDLEPDRQAALRLKGVCLRMLGKYDQAIWCFERLLAQAPESTSVQWALARSYLSLGYYKQGWELYMSRINLRHVNLKREFAGQPWHGENLTGKTIVLFAEQGFGDNIMTLRFVKWVKQRGAEHVYFECEQPLKRLAQGVPGIDSLFLRGTQIPDHDYQCSLLSLPGVFDVRLNTIPPPAPLAWFEEDRQRFKTIVERHAKPTELKVGIVWTGGDAYPENHLRAATLDHFLRFAALPHVRLFSLQKEPGNQALAELACPALVVDLAPYIQDFADTAAALQELDLVVMTDSSVAHLAASLDVPVWNLLGMDPYWPYLTHRDDTPWYPSMRLFRQPEPGHWDLVFDHVAGKLHSVAEKKAAGDTPLRQMLLPFIGSLVDERFGTGNG